MTSPQTTTTTQRGGCWQGGCGAYCARSSSSSLSESASLFFVMSLLLFYSSILFASFSQSALQSMKHPQHILTSSIPACVTCLNVSSGLLQSLHVNRAVHADGLLPGLRGHKGGEGKKSCHKRELDPHDLSEHIYLIRCTRKEEELLSCGGQSLRHIPFRIEWQVK